ncbi:MAG: ribosome biogenesis GTP-binding protein YsxC [Candidatus Pacebacteria bacterium]|nr:ribosome biogenesis GTP-binding protein YsxC [Candidatus Paceibacterota bacterium]
MKINSAIFIKGIRGTDSILESDFLHLAFYGRSNVGKSSVINTILGRKNLVKSSSKPGKTKELNFFKINEELFIVDLPGYGYAKVSQKEREKLRKLILWYLLYSDVKNRINVIVLDSKVGLTDYDEELINILQKNNEKIIILLNKIDKIKQGVLFKQIKSIQKKIGTNIEIISFSAFKKRGIEKFWEIFNIIKKKL